MCNFKSFIILKDRIYMPDHNDHSKMLEELGIKDDSREPNFVRGELIPPNNDPFTDVADWGFVIDQDYRPEWFIAELDEPRARGTARDWKEDRVFDGVDDIKLRVDYNATYYFRDCQNIGVVAVGGANVRMDTHGSSTGRMVTHGSSTGRMVTHGSSTGSMDTWDSSTGSMSFKSAHSKFSYIVANDSTFKDIPNRRVYQSGGFELIAVESGYSGGDNVEDK